ncbi:MAG: AMP-binding protein, partial [Mobilicoccus sp.]|nr:AMP-binding protein [Mobilicoccus sp.]
MTLRRSTVADVVRRSARRQPERVALTFADRSWTYADLDAAVTRAAAHLLGLGLSHGDRVAAFGKNSDAYLVGFLACARA